MTMERDPTPPSPYDVPDPEPLASCGCPESECTPAFDAQGDRYCEACGDDLPYRSYRPRR